MGMAAPQSRLLALTARDHDIGYELQNLSRQRTENTRAARVASQKYQNTLSTKIYKYSTTFLMHLVLISLGNISRNEITISYSKSMFGLCRWSRGK